MCEKLPAYWRGLLSVLFADVVLDKLVNPPA
jgi:hypothetical protein